jgi:type IV secretory pathway VirB4 component
LYSGQKIKIDNSEGKLYTILAENTYIKKDLDRYLVNKIKNKDKKKLTFDESKQLLFKYCNENEKVPLPKEQYENVNIGTWYYNQKGKIDNSEDKLYKILAENKYVKERIDKYLEIKHKKKDKLKFDQ